MLLVPALWSFGYFFPPLNHDAALILDVAARWLNGARLYVDVIDVNPPLIFLLSTVPELLFRATGLADSTLWFTALVLALAAGSLGLSARVLRTAPDLAGPVGRQLLLPLLAFLLLVYPDDMFGQREHLMHIAAAPYLIAAAARSCGAVPPRTLLLPVMLLAGIGFALKPHFLLAPALIELLIACMQRRIRWRDSALFALAFGPLLQAGLVLFATPAYLSDIVPLGLRLYAEQRDAMWGVATGSLIGPAIILVLPLAAMSMFFPALRLQRMAALYSIAGLLSAVLQAKGWAYQALPASAGSIFLLFISLAAVIERHAIVDRRPRAATSIAAMLMLACYYHVFATALPFQPQRGYAGSDTRRLEEIVRHNAFDGRLLIISPGVLPHFPMVNYTGVRLTGRFESMWLLQGAYAECSGPERYRAPSRMTADEKRIFDGLPLDFAHDRPSLVIIDRDAGIPVCDGQAFDYLEYFGRHSLFAAAIQEYEEIAGFDRYRIFRRQPEQAAVQVSSDPLL